MDHDQRFKVLLQEFLREFLLLVVPEWADRFDDAAAEWLLQEVFVDPPQGQRQYVDLVVKLPLRQPATREQEAELGPWLTLIHIEVESSDSVALFRSRISDYSWMLRHRHQLPVLSVGLFLKVGLEGLGWDTHEIVYFGRRTGWFSYPYLGLPALDAMTYVHGQNLLGVGLSVLMRVPEERRAELKAEALERVATSGQSDLRKWLLCECVEAYLPLEGPHLAEYERLLRTERYREALTMATTSFERGRADGERAVLQRMLTRKFGPLSETAKTRLGSWSEERLLQAADDLIAGRSLREIGLEDESTLA
jgi:hypothetical protein